jgi:hypothetical protein
LTGLAIDALSRINTFNLQTNNYIQLFDEASRAEALSQSALEERRGDPEEIFRLYRRVYQARILVLDRRYETGQSICDLYSITGFHIDDFPTFDEVREADHSGVGSNTDTISSESGLSAE